MTEPQPTGEIPEALRAVLPDRYALDRVLGRGGMATVYLAEDRKHERRLAIKVLHPELAASIASERFLEEIRLAAPKATPWSPTSGSPERSPRPAATT
jgi:serine/threonine-protein kinase